MVKTLILFFLMILPICAHCSVIICSEMVDDDSTENFLEFKKCLAAAENEPEKTVRIPIGIKGSYYKIAYPNIPVIPKRVTVIGDDGVKFNGTIRLSNYSTIDNIEFKTQRRSIIIGENELVVGAVVKNCIFGDGDWASILAYRANDTLITNNEFYALRGGNGQNIQFLGGKRNKIINNYVYGGTVCISLKYSRSTNGPAPESTFEDFLIEGNTCEYPLEEGISFDIAGEASYAVPTLERDFVASSSIKSVTLSHPNWAPTGNPNYVGYDVIFLTGTMAGQTRLITGQSKATFNLSSSISGVKPGDEVLIGAPYKRNIIRGNTVIKNDASAILFFGMGYGNIIENNKIIGFGSRNNGGIGIKSLDNIAKPKNSVTGELGRAPNCFNVIRNNTLSGNIALFYHPDNNMKYIPVSARYQEPFHSYGNIVVNNKLGGRLHITHQKELYINNNEYSSIYTQDVSYSPKVSFDIPTNTSELSFDQGIPPEAPKNVFVQCIENCP